MSFRSSLLLPFAVVFVWGWLLAGKGGNSSTGMLFVSGSCVHQAFVLGAGAGIHSSLLLMFMCHGLFLCTYSCLLTYAGHLVSLAR